MLSNDYKFDVFIEGKSINLIVLNEYIAQNSNWYNWFNDQRVTQHMQKHYFPNTRELQEQYFKSSVESTQVKLQLGIAHRIDNCLIGTVSLNNIDYINRNCEISGVIGEKDYQDLSNFTEAFQLLIKHAFLNLNMHRVYSGSFSKEIDALMCRLIGFKSEGLLKEAVYKDGVYRDIYLHALLRSDFDKKSRDQIKL